MNYSDQFAAVRETRGFTREQLAKVAGCHRNTVINVESGRPVKFRTIVELMRKMGYADDSVETKLLALLWLEDTTGVKVSPTEAKRLGQRQAKRSAEPVRELTAQIDQRRLDAEEIALLSFAARHARVRNALRAIRELLDSQETADA